ncbi:MAG: hypothetical protein KGJ23_14430 [Euryarchaeota archaeon]|nr:hypothetical protein [Euryarchaeota archaeon]MDE1837796.1 hypothetical protein [Euryarchaeota archaeon]MDE2046180.1 hypothetical protein [Thermoplasmata archaeon]
MPKNRKRSTAAPAARANPPSASGKTRPATPPTAAKALVRVSAPPMAPSPSPSSTPGTPLLRLEKPFDVDEFCQQLGETRITATVPRESLHEVLKRIVEFMEFGIYVYAVVVLPGPSPTLEKFTLQLDRIDFDVRRKGWTPFQEKGRSTSPFGPGDTGSSSTPPHP